MKQKGVVIILLLELYERAILLGITCTYTELNERSIRVTTLVYANSVGGWIMLYIQDDIYCLIQ